MGWKSEAFLKSDVQGLPLPVAAVFPSTSAFPVFGGGLATDDSSSSVALTDDCDSRSSSKNSVASISIIGRFATSGDAEAVATDAGQPLLGRRQVSRWFQGGTAGEFSECFTRLTWNE